jgi:Kef-type K+ transport system membrane component KefB
LPSNAAAAQLPLVLLLIFGTAKLLAELCERIGQPGIVGEIVAGVLLGPSVLNWVQPNDVLTVLSELGVMFLLFRVGMEVRASELLGVGRTALIVALAGVALPFFAGWLIMAIVGVSRTEAIFVGAAMVATSVGITAQFLGAKGLLQERASKTILAAAVIDDVLGLLVLAVVTNVAEGQVNVIGLLTTAVVACLFTVGIAKFGSRALKHVVPKIEQRLSEREARFNLAIIALFALSLLAVYIGIAAIVGAFLAGLAFSESVDRRVKDLTHGVAEVFVPFFLAGIGLELRLSDFSEGRILLLSAVITAAALITKLIGCGIGSLHFGRSDALRVGIGMMPRGEVGMVVAQIGLSLGVIEKPVYGVIVFMAVATTVLAPPFLSLAFRGCKQKAAEEEFSLA